MTSTSPPTIDPSALFAAVSALGIGGTAPSVDAVFSGGEHHTYKLTFKNHESLAVRVPLYTGIVGSISSTPEDVIDTVRHEMRTLEMLEEKGFKWAPRCLGGSLTFENEIGSPFLVLTWVEGETLRWDDELPPSPQREKVLGEIAGIQASLIECTLKTGT
jgi:aminoglycoside phosphotransferase (APT) family kinase protein